MIMRTVKYQDKALAIPDTRVVVILMPEGKPKLYIWMLRAPAIITTTRIESEPTDASMLSMAGRNFKRGLLGEVLGMKAL